MVTVSGKEIERPLNCFRTGAGDLGCSCNVDIDIADNGFHRVEVDVYIYIGKCAVTEPEAGIDREIRITIAITEQAIA